MPPKSNESLDHLVLRLEERIPRITHEANVPGLSIALIRNGETAWAHGFGVMNTETRQPVKPETVFEGCSLSKPVFAYAALKLCETGRLALDRPLSLHLPNPYVPNDPRVQKMTMRQALAHTSGFPNWRPDCWDSEGWDPEGGLLQTYFEPGERFSYSGEGYMYVQHVVEHVTAGLANPICRPSCLSQPEWSSAHIYVHRIKCLTWQPVMMNMGNRQRNRCISPCVRPPAFIRRLLTSLRSCAPVCDPATVPNGTSVPSWRRK